MMSDDLRAYLILRSQDFSIHFDGSIFYCDFHVKVRYHMRREISIEIIRRQKYNSYYSRNCPWPVRQLFCNRFRADKNVFEINDEIKIPFVFLHKFLFFWERALKRI